MFKHSFRPTQMANPMQDFPECKVAVGAASLHDGRLLTNWR